MSIVDDSDSLRTTLIGDAFPETGKDNDWSGIVRNGVVRDKQHLANIDLGDKALGTKPTDGTGWVIVYSELSVCISSSLLNTEDWVYCGEKTITKSTRPLPDLLPVEHPTLHSSYGVR